MASFHTFNENVRVDLLLPPATQGSLNTAWIQPFANGGGGNRTLFLLTIGATTENVTAKVTQATSSAGAGAKDVTGATITAVTSSTDNVIVTIDLGPNALDGTNGYTWIRLEVTVAAAGTTPYSVAELRYVNRYPGNFEQADSYAEAVVVLG